MTKGKAIARDTNKKGIRFALVKMVDGTYSVYKECQNYCGHIKGGIKKTWRVVSKGLNRSDAVSLYNRRRNGTQI